MKKIFYLFVVLLLLLSAFVTAVPKIKNIKGDINFDGRLDSNDMNYLLLYALGYGSPNSLTLCIADFDNNNRITILDVLYVAQTIQKQRKTQIVHCNYD